MIGRLLSLYILPAQKTVAKNVPLEIKHHGDSMFTQQLLATSDGAMLDTVTITPRRMIDKTNVPHVIYFCGMRGCYRRKLNEYRARAERYGHVAVCFNYRNVGNSVGEITSELQLINDGKAQVQHLIGQNIPARKIFLYGLSLGGAIATLVAADYQQNNKRVRLINHVSFTRLLDALPEKWYYIKPLIGLLANYYGWELNALAAIKHINPKDILFIAAEQDLLISYSHASILNALQQQTNLEHAYLIGNGVELNAGMDDPSDPETRYGVHGAKLEKLFDTNHHPIIDSVYEFVNSQPSEHLECNR